MNEAVICVQFGTHSVKVRSDILRARSEYFDALFRFSSGHRLVVIALEEPLGEALHFVIGNLLCSASDQRRRLSAPDRAVLGVGHWAPHPSADFLFECIVLCSKYLLDDFERHYSQLLVQLVSQSAANYSCTDVIPPPATAIHLHPNHRSNYLSLLQIRQLARAYHLQYLHTNLTELIERKRALGRQRLRKLYGI